MNCAPGLCQRLETCMDSNCSDHPNQHHNQWGAGHPLPLHRQVLPPEPKQGEEGDYQAGLWMVYTAAALILAAFFFMTWLAYPNLPQ